MSGVRTQTRGAVLWVVIDRPARRNALNVEALAALQSTFVRAASEPMVRAIVLTGAGDQAFSTGGDIEEGTRADGGVFASAMAEHPLAAVYRAMRHCPKPIVARVNGKAVGGGLGLVSACDLAVAADHAEFGLPEARVGLFPMMASTFALRQLPRRRYQAMAYLAQPLGAAEALACHLVNEVVPRGRLDARVEEIVARLLAHSPQAFALGKQALDVMQDLTLDQVHAYATLMVDKVAATADAREGMAAFLEKRRPRWTSLHEGVEDRR